MSMLDLFIVGVLTISVAVGILRGFIREALSLAKWVLASAGAWLFADLVADMFEASIEDPTVRLAVGFLLLFITLFVAVSVATHVVNKLLGASTLLKTSNTLLGAGVGVIRGVLILVIVFLFAGLLPGVPQSKWWQASLLAPYVKPLALFAGGFMPGDIARHIRYD